MRKLFSELFVVLLFFLPLKINGQTKKLSLDDAISLALKNNQYISLAKYETKKSSISLSEAESNKYPSVYGETRYLYAPENGYNPAVTNGGEYSLQISSNYTLYDGGIRSSLINENKINLAVSNLNLKRVKSNIKYKVRSLFYLISNTEQEIEIRIEAARRLEDYFNLLTGLKNEGLASESDVLKTKLSINSTYIIIDGLKQKLGNLKYSLNNVLGRPIDHNIEISQTTGTDTTLQTLSQSAQTLEIKLAEKNIELTNAYLTSAKAERLPNISMRGDIGLLGIKPQEYKKDAGYSLFLSVSVPLFTWGAIDDRVQRAEISHEQALTNINIQKRGIETKHLAIMKEIDLAQKNMKQYKINIKIAEDNYLSALSRFKGGNGSSLEVLNAQNLIVDAKINYDNSLLQLENAKAGLMNLYGM